MSLLPALLCIGGLLAAAMLVAVGLRWQPLSDFRLKQRQGRHLVLRESLALDPRRRVHLVECGDRRVLLLTGGQQDVVIGWLQGP